MTHEESLLSICARPVPQQVRLRARLHVLDWLGIALAARNAPQAVSLERHAGLETGTLLASALSGSGVSSAEAAFLMGGLGSILEMDDLHNASLMHAGNAVIPAALSAGRAAGASGGVVLDAIVRGYETAIRIGATAASGGYRPFVNSSACGIFGAAIAAADVTGLDCRLWPDALAQAGMMASGVWQCRLEPGAAKQVAGAHAARGGVEAASLARAGAVGPKAILSGPLGFFAAFYPYADVAGVAKGADNWKLEEVSFKPWPACRHTHPAIGAALEIGQACPERIVVRTYGAAIEFCDCPDPRTDDEARFSLQHAVAVALVKGAPEIADFGEVARRDERIAALRRRVVLERDAEMTAAFPRTLAAQVLADDVAARTAHALGDPENPMSKGDLCAKFHRNAQHAGIGSDAAKHIEHAALSLAGANSLVALTGAVSAAMSAPEHRWRTL